MSDQERVRRLQMLTATLKLLDLARLRQANGARDAVLAKLSDVSRTLVEARAACDDDATAMTDALAVEKLHRLTSSKRAALNIELAARTADCAVAIDAAARAAGRDGAADKLAENIRQSRTRERDRKAP